MSLIDQGGDIGPELVITDVSFRGRCAMTAMNRPYQPDQADLTDVVICRSLRVYRPLNYDPYDPGDEWPDDVPGLMRVHVIQERARRLCQANSRDELRAYLREHGEPIGGSKHDLAFRIVNRPQRQAS